MAINWGSVLGGVTTGLASGGIVGAVAGAVSGAVGGGATGKGKLINGTVTDTFAGYIKIRTTGGNIVTIKRAKHRRHSGHKGNGMNSMLKTAMQYKMLANAMK